MDVIGDTQVSQARCHHQYPLLSSAGSNPIQLDVATGIAASVVPDAPPFSFDLKTTDRIFTLAAEDKEMMIKVFVFPRALANTQTLARTDPSVLVLAFVHMSAYEQAQAPYGHKYNCKRVLKLSRSSLRPHLHSRSLI